MSKNLWVLTKEYNDHDQHGEYFICIFEGKPSSFQLMENGVSSHCTNHVLEGGGRIGQEYEWYYLYQPDDTEYIIGAGHD